MTSAVSAIFGRLERAVRRYLDTRTSYRFFLREVEPLLDLERGAAMLGTMRLLRKLQVVRMDRPRAGRITVLAPHPDDEAIGPGGTLLRSIAHGAEVTVVYLTDGRPERDGAPAGDDSAGAEASQAAARFGFRTRFLGFPAARIPIDDAAVTRFAEVVTAGRPEAVFVPFLLDDHDDHRRVSELLLAAVRDGLLDVDCEIWAYQVYAMLPCNVVVDMTDQAEAKAELIGCYQSEAGVREWAHWALGLNAFNSRLLGRGEGTRYAEAFLVLPLSGYLEMCAAYFDPDPRACYYNPAYRETA